MRGAQNIPSLIAMYYYKTLDSDLPDRVTLLTADRKDTNDSVLQIQTGAGMTPLHCFFKGPGT